MVLAWLQNKYMKKRIYLLQSGTLKREDNNVAFIESKSGNKIYLPIYQLECIYVYGHCNFNKEVLNLFNEHKVILLLFTFTGNYIGSFCHKHNVIGLTLIKQVNFVTDENIKTKYSVEIIKTSLKNMIAVLKYYNKKGIDLINNINAITNYIEKIEDNPRKLLIYEARAKQAYYTSFNLIIKNKDFIFNNRSTNPTLDAMNAVMSYGYAILYGIIENDIYKSNLTISLPFIHGLTKRNTGLQYDIADIFKPIIIDRLIFRLINKKQLLVTHFDIHKDKVLLNKEGSKLFIKEFEKSIQSIITITRTKKMSYRSIIKREVQNIEKSIKNDTNYKGFVMRW